MPVSQGQFTSITKPRPVAEVLSETKRLDVAGCILDAKSSLTCISLCVDRLVEQKKLTPKSFTKFNYFYLLVPVKFNY
jgi:hypothetical protein